MASGGEIGGYDYSLVDEAQTPRYSCTICTMIFKDPHLTACCGQHFCASCMQRWLESQSTCPNCREGLFQHFLDKKFVREINSLKVKCPNNKDGCTCELELGSLKQHLENGCDYALTWCPKCYTRVVRKDLSNHLESKCPNRPYQCQYCGKTGRYRNHGNNCKGKPVNCPNMCGERDIKQKNLQVHREKCPLEPVDCPFSDNGCTKRPARRDLNDHVERSVKDHLLLTAKTCKRLQKSNIALTSLLWVMIRKSPESEQRELESIQSFFDDSYHLRRLGDKIQIKAHYGHLDDSYCGPGIIYMFYTPTFYLLDGYKVYLDFELLFDHNKPTPYIDSELSLKDGEYDDLLEWPLCNDYEISISFSISQFYKDVISAPSSSESTETFSLTKPVPICSECTQNSLDRVKYHDDETPIFHTRDKLDHWAAGRFMENKWIYLTLSISRHNHAKRRKLTQTSITSYCTGRTAS